MREFQLKPISARQLLEREKLNLEEIAKPSSVWPYAVQVGIGFLNSSAAVYLATIHSPDSFEPAYLAMALGANVGVDRLARRYCQQQEQLWKHRTIAHSIFHITAHAIIYFTAP